MAMRGAPKVQRDVALGREATAWRLREQGRTQAQIAEELGVTQPAVSRMLRRFEKKLVKELAEEALVVKVRQTRQLEYIAAQAMLGWERSKQPKKTVGRRSKAGGEGQADEVTTQQVSEQCGDVRFLTEVRAALADIRKIWGVDAPQKHEVSAAPTPIKLITVFQPDQAGRPSG
jgi:predicted XRE-type DNA-binding protein